MIKHRELSSLVFISTAIAVYTMMNRYLGDVSGGMFIFFCIFLFVAWLRVGKRISLPRLLLLFLILISVSILLFSVFILKVPAGIALTVFVSGLVIAKSFSLTKFHDYAQLMVLSVMAIIAGGALSVTSDYVVLLAIYVVLSGYCIYKMHLVKEYLLHYSPNSASSVVIDKKGHKPGFGSYIPVLLVTAGIAFIVFTLVPRESPAWLVSGVNRNSSATMTGFSQKMILGEIGVLLKDKSPVMRIKVSCSDKRSISYRGMLYLRGDVYQCYGVLNNRWQWLAVHPDKYNRQIVASPYSVVYVRKPNVSKQELCKWDIFYRRPVSTNLFVVGLPVAVSTIQQMNLTYNAYDNVIIYSSYPDEGFHYTLWTEPFRYIDIRPIAIKSHPKRFSYKKVEDIGRKKLVAIRNRMRISENKFDDMVKVERVKAIDERRFRRFLLRHSVFSRKELKKGGLSAEERAHRIMTYLKTNFHYSLDNRDVAPDKEPVWDFLVRRKHGHCEYFASAMVLLSRAAGLNARLVAGFKGGKYNDIGKYYIIRNCDAHTWVEVYVPNKGWRRYDPTPADRERYLFAEENFFAKPFWDFIDLIKFSWIEKISALKKTKQIVTKVQKHLLSNKKNEHYERIKEFFSKMLNYIKDRKYGSVWFQMLHWIVGILLISLAILFIRILSEVLQILNRAIRDIFEQRWQKKFGPAWHCPVEFYRKLLLWMISRGLARKNTETASEYAERIIGQYPQVIEPIRLLTDRYLYVRFGGKDIDRDEMKLLLNKCYEVQKTIKEIEKRNKTQAGD